MHVLRTKLGIAGQSNSGNKGTGVGGGFNTGTSVIIMQDRQTARQEVEDALTKELMERLTKKRINKID